MPDIPGISGSPVSRVVSSILRKGKGYKRTAVDVLGDGLRDAAGVHLLHALGLERVAVLASVEHAARVHGLLERVAL